MQSCQKPGTEPANCLECSKKENVCCSGVDLRYGSCEHSSMQDCYRADWQQEFANSLRPVAAQGATEERRTHNYEADSGSRIARSNADGTCFFKRFAGLKAWLCISTVRGSRPAGGEGGHSVVHQGLDGCLQHRQSHV